MTPQRFQRLIHTLDRRRTDLTLLTDQMHKPRNIAALVRTADAFGLMDLHMVWKEGYQRPFKGTALGSQQWVDVHHHPSMGEAVTALKGQGFSVFAAHLSHRAKHFRSVDFTRPCVLLLGNEKKGVSDDAAEMADEHIIIPMEGMVESFNVSVAAAIILSEAQRQREAEGRMDSGRLTGERYWQTFFRWAHPKVAQFCNARGIDYPRVDRTTGDIVDAPKWYAQVKATPPS